MESWSVCLCVCLCVERGGIKGTRKEEKKNVRPFVHEIKRYLQNTPACEALWQTLLEVSLSHFLFVCREGKCETE